MDEPTIRTLELSGNTVEIFFALIEQTLSFIKKLELK